MAESGRQVIGNRDNDRAATLAHLMLGQIDGTADCSSNRESTWLVRRRAARVAAQFIDEATRPLDLFQNAKQPPSYLQSIAYRIAYCGFVDLFDRSLSGECDYLKRLIQ